MNINIVCDYASIYSGNFIPSVVYFAEMAKENNNVVFLFPNDAKEREWVNYIKSLGFDVFFFSRNKKEFIKNLKFISQKTNPDLIYYHFVSPALGKIPFLFKKTRLCFHIHSDFNGGKKPSLLTRFKEFFFDHFVKTNSLYFFVSADLLSKSGAKIKYHIPNGLVKDRHCFVNGESLIKERIMTELNNLREPIFLAFAWSPFIKGIDILCKAFNNFTKKNNATLLLVYRKDDGKNELLSFLKSNDIALDNIVLLPPTEDVDLYYSKCTCFVSSSRSEGFSYSVLESIALNKNIIISDIPGTAWAKDFNYVVLFENENVNSLEEAMNRVSHLQKTNDKNKQNEIMLQSYSIENWFGRIKFAFEERGLIL